MSQEEGRNLKRSGERTMNAAGGAWTPLTMLLYLQSALKVRPAQTGTPDKLGEPTTCCCVAVPCSLFSCAALPCACSALPCALFTCTAITCIARPSLSQLPPCCPDLSCLLFLLQLLIRFLDHDPHYHHLFVFV